MFVSGRRMLMGELAMVFGRRGVILRVFVIAKLVMMRRLMMVVGGSVMVRGSGLMMLAGRMCGCFGHVLSPPLKGGSQIDPRDDL
jgi:uncharacterized membrane protein YedE/YeeE